LNLETLFEFCIPCIQNYGIALKLNDCETCLGADFLGVGDSGIDQLFPRRRRGRPRHGDEKKEISLKVCCLSFFHTSFRYDV